MILETKLDKNFPNGRFLIKGFSESNKPNKILKELG